MTIWDHTNNRFAKFADFYGSAKSAGSTIKGLIAGTKKSGATGSGDTAVTAETKTSVISDVEKKLTISNNAIWQDFKLYIEGEECPFESATISFGVSAIPMVTLQLAPYKILRDLPERTKVHLYFICPVDGEERLLFDGEIGGVGYTKNPHAQTLTYSVTHVSNYLNEILVSFFDISAYAVTFPPLYTKTLGSELETDYSSYNTTTLEKLLDPTALKGLNTFQEIFVNIFTEIFKVKEGETSLNATLAYFKRRVNEWKLDKRMATLPAASGQSNAVFRFQDFIDSENLLLLFAGITKKIDGWQSLFTVLGEMFMEIRYYPIILPSPYLYHDEQTEAEIDTVNKYKRFGTSTADLEKKYMVRPSLQSILYKPQALFVLPPICNVIWPSMYTVFSYSRNYKDRPTRLFVRAGMERRMGTGKKDNDIAETAAQYFWSPAELRDAVGGATKSVKSAETVAEIKVVDKYKWYGTSTADLEKKYQSHISLLDMISQEEGRVGVRLSQPADNEFFTRYAEWLTYGDFKDYPYLKKLKDFHDSVDATDKVAQLADYELARQRFETESVSMVMVFNPYIVPGFPALIMDKPESGMHVYGYVSGVTHTISAAGGSSTMVDIGYIHQYDDKVDKRFVVAEDVWADEDAVYERLLGVKSIKGAEFNTVVDEKKKDDAIAIVESIAGDMSKDGFHDYIYNAYVRSHRKIVTKKEYDEFVDIENNMTKPDLEKRREIQDKVKLYRSWVQKRVAGNESLWDVAAGAESAAIESTGSSGPSGTDILASTAPVAEAPVAEEVPPTIASKTEEKKTASEIWEVGGGVSAEDKAKDEAFYASREKMRKRKTFGW